ncbi:SGNH/GDSL hydrolase family protein [Subsaxibacter sp. CAU 1640]|nr:SGNH/GDSL hydrolase family protein [Subsaxibacter sp. CAU 1640]MCK7589140.1 SGNH/GDSL hydrolase family protein [Subsaxibacter sp. CAU 1640]
MNSGEEVDTTGTDSTTLKILSLGDSYTIGQSVCETCRFPAQLKDSLTNSFTNTEFTLEIIATTGWTTTNLLNAVAQQNPDTDFDLVTLLIGVNNQYQGKPFSLYETEFPTLVDKAIEAANGDKNRVIVVSIPDYAYTPFGQGNSNAQTISTEIDQYNNFAQSYCEANDITYVYITDITRLGLEQPELVASDGLHPSELAYSKFVERLIPIATAKLQ